MGLFETLVYGVLCWVIPGTDVADEIEAADAGWGCHGDGESIRHKLQSIFDQNDF